VPIPTRRRGRSLGAGLEPALGEHLRAASSRRCRFASASRRSGRSRVLLANTSPLPLIPARPPPASPPRTGRASLRLRPLRSRFVSGDKGFARRRVPVYRAASAGGDARPRSATRTLRFADSRGQTASMRRGRDDAAHPRPRRWSADGPDVVVRFAGPRRLAPADNPVRQGSTIGGAGGRAFRTRHLALGTTIAIMILPQLGGAPR